MYRQNSPDRGRNSKPTRTNDRRRTGPSAATNRPRAIETVGAGEVRRLPIDRSVPSWLKSLVAIQRLSLVLFCGVLGLSAIVYSYTVYTQDTWKSQHGQLRRLQKQERQQGVMNENLKQQMAQTAEQSNSGLVSPTPDRIIVIPRPSQRPVKSIATDPTPTPSPSPATKPPLGY